MYAHWFLDGHISLYLLKWQGKMISKRNNLFQNYDCWQEFVDHHTDIKCSKPWFGVCIYISYSWLLGHINIVIMNFYACSVTVRMLQHISCNLKLDNQRSCLSSWSIFDLILPTLLNTLMNNKIPVLSIKHDQMVDSWWNKLVEVTYGVPKRQSMMHVSVLSGMEVLRQLFNTNDFLHDQIN